MLGNNEQIIVEENIFIEQRKSDSSTICRNICGNARIPRLDSNLHFRRNVKRNDEITCIGVHGDFSRIFLHQLQLHLHGDRRNKPMEKKYLRNDVPLSVARLGKWGQIKNAMRFVKVYLMQIRKKERWENIYRRQFSERSCFHIIVTLE